MSAGGEPVSFSLAKPEGLGVADLVVASLVVSYPAFLLLELAQSNFGWAALGLSGLFALFWDLGVKDPKVRSEPCKVRIADGVVDLDGVTWPAQEIAEVRITARAEQTVLTIVWGESQERICCRSPHEAETLLRAMGIDLRSHKVHLAMASRAATFASAWADTARMSLIAAVLAVAAWFLWRGDGSAALPVVALMMAIPAWIRALSLTPKTRVWVGADAIEWAWLGKRRHVRYADIAALRELADAGPEGERRVELSLKNGKRVAFAPRSAAERELLGAGLRRHRERAQQGHGAMLEVVQRRGRSIDTWVQALRALGTGASHDMRTPALDPDALERLATDPDAETADRVAAAIILREGGELESLERVRIASAKSDTPHVRVALARLTADADERALSEALAEVSDDEGATATMTRTTDAG